MSFGIITSVRDCYVRECYVRDCYVRDNYVVPVLAYFVVVSMPKKKRFVALALRFHSVANVIKLFTAVSYDFS